MDFTPKGSTPLLDEDKEALPRISRSPASAGRGHASERLMGHGYAPRPSSAKSSVSGKLEGAHRVSLADVVALSSSSSGLSHAQQESHLPAHGPVGASSITRQTHSEHGDSIYITGLDGDLPLDGSTDQKRYERSTRDTTLRFAPPQQLRKAKLKSGRMMTNSFVAASLLKISLVILVIDVVSLYVAVKYTWKDRTRSVDECTNFIRYSMFASFCAPLNIIIALSATGFSVFKLFERQPNSTKLKRKFWLNLCEFAVTILVALFMFYIIFFLTVVRIMIQESDSCFGESGMQMFGDVAVICLCVLKMLLSYWQLQIFDVFRSRSRAQLGTFDELSQSNYTSKWIHPNANSVADLRKKLYKAVSLCDTLEATTLLIKARDTYGTDFVNRIFASPSLSCGLFAESKKNPMHVAAASGDIEMLELLKSYGFDVNAMDKVDKVRFSISALYVSFTNWITSGVGFNKVKGTGTGSIRLRSTLVSPLHVAVARGKLAAVRWLVENGADVNCLSISSKSAERVPPLFYADDTQIALALLAADANVLLVPNVGSFSCTTVLEYQYYKGNDQLCSLYKEWGGDICLTPLHAASAKNEIRTIAKLLNAGASVDCLGEQYEGFHRFTPLHWAAVSGSHDAARLLLERGADVNARDARGRTPLHWAARRNRASIVKLLNCLGAEPDAIDNKDDRRTPILFAAEFDGVDKEVFLTLRQAGANIDARLPNEDTALHVAAKHENLKTALSLVNCDADVMASNLEGKRAIDCTTSTALAYAIKQEAGARDVMISYTHSHAEFATKIHDELKKNNVTVWMDNMNPSGIEGGAVWRASIARGISEATLVLCILSEDYPSSSWCLKELAFAKNCEKPILAISCEDVTINDELQVYLYTRQIIPFKSTIVSADRENPKNVRFTYDENAFLCKFKMLLDGVRDMIETSRVAKKDPKLKESAKSETLMKMLAEMKTQPREGGFVFISSGDCHNELVAEMVQALEAQDIPCYVDSRYLYGSMQVRMQKTKDFILRCSAFVVVLSPKTVGLDIISDQLAFAEDKGKYVIPVLYSDVQLDFAKLYSLSRSKFVHFCRHLGTRDSVEDLIYTVKMGPNSKPSQDLGQPRPPRSGAPFLRSASFSNSGGSLVFSNWPTVNPPTVPPAVEPGREVAPPVSTAPLSKMPSRRMSKAHIFTIDESGGDLMPSLQ